MAKNTPFSETYRPYDGILIQARKDISFSDPDFNETLNRLSQKTYQVGIKGCKYNPVSDAITLDDFGRLPAFFFEHVVVAADFQIGQLVEVSDSGQRLYITGIDSERDQVELSFISPSDSVLNLLNANGDFKYKTPVGNFSVKLIEPVEGNYSANSL